MRHGRIRRSLVIAALVGLGLAMAVAPAHAQLGVGARMAVFKGGSNPVLDSSLDASNLRFTGGFIRFKFGQIGVEGSLDYRNDSNRTGSGRILTYPLQATVLYELLGGPVSPYLLGGIGWYTRKFEALADGEVVAEALTRNRGYHVGAGAELKLGRHAAIFVDYRYMFTNSEDMEQAASAALGQAVFGSLFGSGFGVKNRSSMWTAGAAFYF